jgi:predicted kinase
VAELMEPAARNRDRREQLAARRRRQEQARRARAQAAAREQHLTALALRQDQAWRQVRAAINTRRPSEYDAAIQLLKDLRAVSEREERREGFEQQLEDVRQTHSKKLSLLDRLDRAGLGAGTGSPLGDQR